MKFKLMDLKVNEDERGKLVAVESCRQVPFEIKRVFYIYGNEQCLPRAGHANTECEEACICMAGRCQVKLADGEHREAFLLSKPEQMLIIPRNTWVELDQFSPDCILVVFASEYYNNKSYINDFDTYKETVK